METAWGPDGVEPRPQEQAEPAELTEVADVDAPDAVEPDDTAAVPDEVDEVPDDLEGADGGETEHPADVPRMPVPEQTGDVRVDEAVSPLQHLGEQATEEHVGAYDAAHGALQEVLADLDRDAES